MYFLFNVRSEFLATDPEVRVRFSALLYFLRSSGSGTRSTEPREHKEEKVEAPVYKTEITTAGIRQADHVAPYIRKKLALTSPTSGGRSVSIVRSRTQATEFSF
jgi:hypothetical protein